MINILKNLKKDGIGELPWDYYFLQNLDEKEYPRYLAKIFNYRTGEKLPLCFDFYKKAWIIDKKRCKTFNQKIQWLKLYGVTDLMRDCTDKVKVRDYVRERIGEEYLKPVLQIIGNCSPSTSGRGRGEGIPLAENDVSTDVIASKSVSIEDFSGNPLNKSNNIDCHADTEMVSSARNDMRSEESIRLSVIANVTTSNTGNVWQSRKNAELDEIATEPKTPSFHSNDMEQKFRDCHNSQNAVEPRNDSRSGLLTRQNADVSTYFDQINWEKLPQAFVIKCNHGCKWQYIIKDKDMFLQNKRLIEIVKEQMTGWLEQEYWCWGGFEMQYKGITPKILIEPLMRNNNNKNVEEIFVYCFNKFPKFTIRIEEGTNNVTTIYNEKLKVVDDIFFKDDIRINKPIDNLINKSFVLSKKLCFNFPFVRVDWMVYNNNLYFEELTFTPYSGFQQINNLLNIQDLFSLSKN